ncbi:cytochrome P450 [Lentzea sp. NBRC 105346]|uniref:cytochrome P450 n=1 Tax=Lentzea sp. NBRC 105346 TaxID=3032205 RepID=UPI00255549A3|nr:cytochrome P450 [Lentzea sp. NBRC 105346]
MLDWFRTMRERWPINWLPERRLCHLFRYSDILSVLADPATFSSNLRMAPDQDIFRPFAKGNFLFMDAPRHRELRGLVNQAFTARAIADKRPRIAAAANDLLDTLHEQPADLATGFAYPLPTAIISDVLGIPAGERAQFHRWTDTFLTASRDAEIDNMFADAFVEAVRDSVAEMNAYLSDQVRQRRAAQREDLLGALVAAEVDGMRLDDEEIVGVVALLMQAGHSTTAMLICNTLLALDDNPDAFAEVRARPERLAAVVDEAMRFSVPTPETMRITTREVELGGNTLPAGTVVVLWLASANRDETVFTEPDRFDPRRTPNPHIGFGQGVHFCLGSSLALQEATVALETLLSRYSEIVVDRDAVEVYQTDSLLAVRRLPVFLRP